MLLVVAIDIVVRANIVADVDICQLASWAPNRSDPSCKCFPGVDVVVEVEVFGLVVDFDVGLALLGWFWRLRDRSDPSFDCFCRC